MNRQQRRLMAKRKEVEQKYLDDIYDRQNRVDDRQIMITLVSVSLALHNFYGWKDHGIERVIQEYIRQVSRLSNGETFEDLVIDLKQKTGIVIRLTDG